MSLSKYNGLLGFIIEMETVGKKALPALLSFVKLAQFIKLTTKFDKPVFPAQQLPQPKGQKTGVFMQTFVANIFGFNRFVIICNNPLSGDCA